MAGPRHPYRDIQVDLRHGGGGYSSLATKAPPRPLLFTVFGWLLSLVATSLILFVIFLLLFLVFENMVQDTATAKQGPFTAAILQNKE